MEITSYFHPRASFLTPAAIRWGVSVGPETNSRGSSCPVARIFTWVPPMSTTRTFMASRTLGGGLRPPSEPPPRTQCEPQDGHGLGPVRPRRAIRSLRRRSRRSKRNVHRSRYFRWPCGVYSDIRLVAPGHGEPEGAFGDVAVRRHDLVAEHIAAGR